MRRVVLYYSKRGTTKEYAMEIANRLNCDIFDAENFDFNEIEQYDTVIWGSYLILGKMKNYKTINKIHKKYSTKNFLYFCVGVLSKDGYQKSNRIIHKSFEQVISHKINLVYLVGFLEVEQLSYYEKIIIYFVKRSLKKEYKLDPTESNKSDIQNLTLGIYSVELLEIREVLELVSENNL